MSYRRFLFGLEEAAIVLFIIGIACVIGIAACRHRNFVAKCEGNGGHVVKYNCHDHTICTTQSDGDTFSTQCDDYEECDYRCDGASAEAAR